MSLPIIWSKQAISDFREIITYLGTQNIRAADEYRDKIIDIIYSSTATFFKCCALQHYHQPAGEHSLTGNGLLQTTQETLWQSLQNRPTGRTEVICRSHTNRTFCYGRKNRQHNCVVREVQYSSCLTQNVLNILQRENIKVYSN